MKDQDKSFHQPHKLPSPSVRSSLEFLSINYFNKNRGISLKQRLPVLSEQITETDPNASTECNFLTIAFLFAILSTPKAKVTVVTIGNPSGIAATAKETVLPVIESGVKIVNEQR